MSEWSELPVLLHRRDRAAFEQRIDELDPDEVELRVHTDFANAIVTVLNWLGDPHGHPSFVPRMASDLATLYNLLIDPQGLRGRQRRLALAALESFVGPLSQPVAGVGFEVWEELVFVTWVCRELEEVIDRERGAEWREASEGHDGHEHGESCAHGGACAHESGE